MAACEGAGTGLWVRQVQKCLPKSSPYHVVGRMQLGGSAEVIRQWIKMLSDAECVFIGLDEIEGAENMTGRACGLVIFVS